LPISRRPARLVVDANPIVAALLGGNARRVFFDAGVAEFAVPEPTIGEVGAHLPILAERLGADPRLLAYALDLLPLSVYPPRIYQASLPEARRRIGRRDPGDVDVLALTLSLGVPLWSNDRDFEGTGVEQFTTAQLLKAFFG
jgi:predicted nucleic acid-binding protein